MKRILLLPAVLALALQAGSAIAAEAAPRGKPPVARALKAGQAAPAAVSAASPAALAAVRRIALFPVL